MEEFTRIASERSPNNMSTTPERDRSKLIKPKGMVYAARCNHRGRTYLMYW